MSYHHLHRHSILLGSQTIQGHGAQHGRRIHEVGVSPILGRPHDIHQAEPRRARAAKEFQLRVDVAQLLPRLHTSEMQLHLPHISKCLLTERCRTVLRSVNHMQDPTVNNQPLQLPGLRCMLVDVLQPATQLALLLFESAQKGLPSVVRITVGLHHRIKFLVQVHGPPSYPHNNAIEHQNKKKDSTGIPSHQPNPQLSQNHVEGVPLGLLVRLRFSIRIARSLFWNRSLHRRALGQCQGPVHWGLRDGDRHVVLTWLVGRGRGLESLNRGRGQADLWV
mmetsp:Transcript_66400/g.151959  ORF Transcript_66400/g.151959 Transcript_66400/m.151959 type:complete len:278 (+) Transcript_66400:3366-4199(+)